VRGAGFPWTPQAQAEIKISGFRTLFSSFALRKFWSDEMLPAYAISMGPLSLASTLPHEMVPQLRELAETVWRLVRRDRSQTAVQLINRVLSEVDPSDLPMGELSREKRAYLLNLRGVLYAQRRQLPEAWADFQAAHKECPPWAVPLFNLGIHHKQANNWSEAAQVLIQARQTLDRTGSRSLGPLTPMAGLQKVLLWSLALVHAALGHRSESREAWQAMGVTLPRGNSGDLGLAQLSLPTKGPYAIERVWVQRLDPVRARILSVVRYGAPCQFGDVVLVDSKTHSATFCDGLEPAVPEAAEPEDAANNLVFLDVLESAGYVLHVIQGGPTSQAQAMTLTERMRDAGLHIEVWSLTMRLPSSGGTSTEGAADGRGAPLCAGLVLPTGPCTGPRWPDQETATGRQTSTQVAERAAQTLILAARELDLMILAPTLMAEAGDELGAARHRKAIRRGQLSQ
jgi:hypothetical protein